MSGDRCFSVKDAAAARELLSEITRRPELAPRIGRLEFARHAGDDDKDTYASLLRLLSALGDLRELLVQDADLYQLRLMGWDKLPSLRSIIHLELVYCTPRSHEDLPALLRPCRALAVVRLVQTTVVWPSLDTSALPPPETRSEELDTVLQPVRLRELFCDQVEDLASIPGLQTDSDLSLDALECLGIDASWATFDGLPTLFGKMRSLKHLCLLQYTEGMPDPFVDLDVSALTALESLAVCFREFTAVKEKAPQNHELHVFERLALSIPSPHLRMLMTAIEDPQAWLRLDSYSFYYGVVGVLERLHALAGPFVKINLSMGFHPASQHRALPENCGRGGGEEDHRGQLGVEQDDQHTHVVVAGSIPSPLPPGTDDQSSRALSLDHRSSRTREI